MSRTDLEQSLIKISQENLMRLLRREKLLMNKFICDKCKHEMKLCNYVKVIDGISWRCLSKGCISYKKRESIRIKSFFYGFRIPILLIIRVLYKWSLNQSQESIISSLEINSRTYKNIINKLINISKIKNDSSMKMGGYGKIVQVDETALNHGVKSHRGRAAMNKTDALCIVEYDSVITRAFCCTIPDKKASTIIPIIQNKVLPNSTIWTDEHKSYCKLNELNYVHDTVCHKKEFINNENGVNTQAVESFNSTLKLEIKRRKGIRKELRQDYLDEFTWMFNNKDSRFAKIWELIKIKEH